MDEVDNGEDEEVATRATPNPDPWKGDNKVVGIRKTPSYNRRITPGPPKQKVKDNRVTINGNYDIYATENERSAYRSPDDSDLMDIDEKPDYYRKKHSRKYDDYDRARREYDKARRRATEVTTRLSPVGRDRDGCYSDDSRYSDYVDRPYRKERRRQTREERRREEHDQYISGEIARAIREGIK
jgi:hypothetical protein